MTAKGYVKAADANLHGVAKRREPHHTDSLSQGKPQLGEALRESIRADNATNAASFIGMQVCQGLFHEDQMIMIFNFTVNSFNVDGLHCREVLV